MLNIVKSMLNIEHCLTSRFMFTIITFLLHDVTQELADRLVGRLGLVGRLLHAHIVGVLVNVSCFSQHHHHPLPTMATQHHNHQEHHQMSKQPQLIPSTTMATTPIANI